MNKSDLSLQPTYEELKPDYYASEFIFDPGLQPTYEELKRAGRRSL